MGVVALLLEGAPGGRVLKAGRPITLFDKAVNHTPY